MVLKVEKGEAFKPAGMATRCLLVFLAVVHGMTAPGAVSDIVVTKGFAKDQDGKPTGAVVIVQISSTVTDDRVWLLSPEEARIAARTFELSAGSFVDAECRMMLHHLQKSLADEAVACETLKMSDAIELRLGTAISKPGMA